MSSGRGEVSLEGSKDPLFGMPPISSKKRPIAFVVGMFATILCIVGAVSLIGRKYSWSIGDLKNISSAVAITMVIGGGGVSIICIIVYRRKRALLTEPKRPPPSKEKSNAANQTGVVKAAQAEVRVGKASKMNYIKEAPFFANNPLVFDWGKITEDDLTIAVKAFEAQVKRLKSRSTITTFIPMPGHPNKYINISIQDDKTYVYDYRSSKYKIYRLEDLNKDNYAELDSVLLKINELEERTVYMNPLWMNSLGYDWEKMLPELKKATRVKNTECMIPKLGLSLKACNWGEQFTDVIVSAVSPQEMG